ncbi:rrbs-1 [Pristionchus pacificus]|uniref:Ribosome biogenesis regulatory protein n=1 Tax=Pristionchus pacificus TaxID=54126 RepID=A0A2A6CF69_PRIPA|nr:rrbs-1 [Pristionchus pacificus]|eukprot:PDM76728.1 rrbs-1 [Pristionchus pacificus]
MTSTVVNKVVDPLVDCGRLLLIDRDPITEFGNEDELITRARNNVQFLFNKVWELDKKRVEDSIVAVLPKPSFKLPREKPIPEKRAATRWEEYAKLKGIAPRKHRNKKVYDEESGEWKPRYGYRSKDNTKEWCIEVPENRGEDADMFAEKREAKKERVAKNETQRLKNMARNLQASCYALFATFLIIFTKNKKKAAIPPEDIARVGLAKEADERTKHDIRVTVDRTRASTASLGKFQKKIHGEKENVKTGKKRQFAPNIQPVSGEKEQAKEVLKHLLTKKPRLLDHTMTTVAAGPAEKEEAPLDASRRKKGGERIRQKNSIHKASYFKNAVKGKNAPQKGNKKGGKGKGRRE